MNGEASDEKNRKENECDPAKIRGLIELQKEKESCRLNVDARRRRRLVSEKG